MLTTNILIAILLLQFTRAQIPPECIFAPQELHFICSQLIDLDVLSRRQFASNQDGAILLRAPSVPGMPMMSPAVPQQSYSPSALDCMDLLCLCPYMHGRINGGVCILPDGSQLQKAVRKEYRMLTDSERNRYHAAIRRLKSTGDYDRLSRIHQLAASSSGAHSGPAFLPWHREYTKRIEIALRLVDPTLTIPYFDSVMDSYLPDPRQSIIWTPLFAGETDQFGNVVNGPYAGFNTLEGRPAITRSLGTEGRLFTENDIRNVVNQQDISMVLSFTAPQAGCPFPPNYGALEYSHGSVHLWVGGDMKPVIRSANDPIFFPHHAFVDFIWELFRQTRQNRWEREQAYPPELASCTNPMHFKNSRMFPFNAINTQGLSNAYTDNLYVYAPRPSCSQRQPTCNSPYIFCDLQHGPAHCVSKIRMNGLCRGFEGEYACYNGECSNGFCRPGRNGQNTMQAVVTHVNSSPKPAQRQSIIPAVAQEQCFNDDPCCSLWASKHECSTNKDFMSRFCKKSCGVCTTRNTKRGCVNRHISCNYFRQNNECSTRRQWMAENCQRSCGWCNLTQIELCATTARMSRM